MPSWAQALLLWGESVGRRSFLDLTESGIFACSCSALNQVFSLVSRASDILGWLKDAQRTLICSVTIDGFLHALHKVQTSAACWGRLFRGGSSTNIMARPARFRQASRGYMTIAHTATAHSRTNPMEWLVLRDNYAALSANMSPGLRSAHPQRLAEAQDRFLQEQANLCLKVAGIKAKRPGSRELMLVSYVQPWDNEQPLSIEGLLAVRAASSVSYGAINVMARTAVTFGLWKITQDCADLSLIFSLFDHLYLSPQLGWQDWLVSASLDLQPDNNGSQLRGLWSAHTTSLSSRQLLSLLIFFTGEGVIHTGNYCSVLRTDFELPMPPLAPLSLACYGKYADLVSLEEWRRLGEFRNRVIHQAQTIRDFESLRHAHW